MSPEKQRIKIAEACGWKIHGTGDWKTTYLIRPDGSRNRTTDPRWPITILLPNYLSDLNAMHEAEKHLLSLPGGDIGGIAYVSWLKHIITNSGSDPIHYPKIHLIHVTAAQRAEALLRTLGLWEEVES